MDRQPHGLPLMATVADGALVATPGLSQSTLPRTSPLRIGVP
ncbi:adhesion G protein-coupled receptor G3 isoform X9 (plasmid) [Acetobacter orientalis]|nr:adhesion G protein-coupled receptor G3 isoform X9 [Acetobacter orientalis]